MQGRAQLCCCFCCCCCCCCILVVEGRIGIDYIGCPEYVCRPSVWISIYPSVKVTKSFIILCPIDHWKSKVDILPAIKIYWKPNHESFKSSSTELLHIRCLYHIYHQVRYGDSGPRSYIVFSLLLFCIGLRWSCAPYRRTTRIVQVTCGEYSLPHSNYWLIDIYKQNNRAAWSLFSCPFEKFWPSMLVCCFCLNYVSPSRESWGSSRTMNNACLA